jgi:hypothetical protein
MSKYGLLSRGFVKMITRVAGPDEVLNVASTFVRAAAKVSRSEAIIRVRLSSALLMNTKCFERARTQVSFAAGKGIRPSIGRDGAAFGVFATGGTA